jgi:hypothetical protein
MCGLGIQVPVDRMARELIERLLCDVEERLGSHGGAAEIKVGHFLPCLKCVSTHCPTFFDIARFM